VTSPTLPNKRHQLHEPGARPERAGRVARRRRPRERHAQTGLRAAGRPTCAPGRTAPGHPLGPHRGDGGAVPQRGCDSRRQRRVRPSGRRTRAGAHPRPAGSRVVLALGWVAKNRGLVQNFLQAQTTTISIDGATHDISDSYSAIEPFPDGGARIAYSSRHRCDAFGRRVPSGGWHAGGFSCGPRRCRRRDHTSAGFLPPRGCTLYPLPHYGLGVSACSGGG
jgi:hypothetical protein